MNTKFIGIIIRVCVFAFAAWLGFAAATHWRSGARRAAALDGRTMGTFWHAVLPGVGKARAGEIGRALDALFADLDGSMSLYDQSSELSLFNAATDTRVRHRLSPDLTDIIRLSIELGRRTGGCFDVTVSPLVELWGFGGKRLKKARPTDADIARALGEVGADFLVFDADGALRKTRPTLGIDLGAVAQGYAADRAARMIEESGVSDFLMDVGGEIVCRGRNARGRLWQIGVEKPSFGQAEGKQVNAVMALSGRAVATSGSYRNFYEEDGRRYTHIIDPRTGRPVGHGMLSVTVLAPDGAAADAYATALMVMGPEEGMDWVAGMAAVEAFFVYYDADGRMAEKASPGFPLIEKRPDA